MKFKVMMQDPGCVYDAAIDAVKRSLRGMPSDDAEVLKKVRIKKALEVASKWFDHGDYLTVEIDTDAGTCVVMENE